MEASLSFIRKYLIFSLALPIAVTAIAALVANLIPGCTIDAGIGASGCGSHGFILSLGIYGGLCAALLGFVGLLIILFGYVALGKKQGLTPCQLAPAQTSRSYWRSLESRLRLPA